MYIFPHPLLSSPLHNPLKLNTNSPHPQRTTTKHHHHREIRLFGRCPIRRLRLIPLFLRARPTALRLRQLHRDHRLCLIHDFRTLDQLHRLLLLLPLALRHFRPIPLLQRHRVPKPPHCISAFRPIIARNPMDDLRR